MFHRMTTTDLSLDNAPESVALAMASADHSYWYAPSDNAEFYVIEDDICSQYSSFEDFKTDFDNPNL